MQPPRQKLVVTVKDPYQPKATLTAYEKEADVWVQAMPTMEAVIGKRGIPKEREGDQRTPIGTFPLGTAFGWGKEPASLRIPFRAVGKEDYWVDDVTSEDYNQWVQFQGDPTTKWASFERMTNPLYKYGVVIEYNTNPIVKGKGSAIFLHVKEPDTRYTQGCVAVLEKNLEKLLQWLDASKYPVIQIKDS
ncbi:L,D-transpeptidase family protein [Pontibacillus yanchengensis]|uniref:L,D-transpeptidase family protein n=1 Tax=Pontibacillus yanchengensis TaxID=462910 RepID=A0ACC7VGB8_9BACI|nr:L,D-transpeptidase family protein [Pontibacillus yanchengensis]MYL53976.1 L,D-transpeptidase family protein [Pontibacillus yanchengensis]